MEGPSLYDQLKEYGKSDVYPCHMPGHKRQSPVDDWGDFFRFDLTEIDGFDDLHHPEEILRQIQEEAAGIYGVLDAYYLVGGSTAGVLTMIHAAVEPGETILMARGCHKSAYHAMLLLGSQPEYLWPGDADGVITADQVASEMEKHPEIRVVLITSPTYEGVCLPVEEIAEEVHKRNGILLVDQAHGAHFGLADGLPKSACSQGADLVVASLHKTLPAPTQTAILLRPTDRISEERIRRYYSVFQSSSPSYPFLAAIQESLRFSIRHPELFEALIRHSAQIKENLKKCRYIQISDRPEDPGKLVIGIAPDYWGKLRLPGTKERFYGHQLGEALLREHQIQMELSADTYVLAIMTLMDTEEGWARLERAVWEIDQSLVLIEEPVEEPGEESELLEECCNTEQNPMQSLIPEKKLPYCVAVRAEKELVLLGNSEGRILGDFVNLYPPGIPLLVPGEVMSKQLLLRLKGYRLEGLRVQGIDEDGKVFCLCQEDRK